MKPKLVILTSFFLFTLNNIHANSSIQPADSSGNPLKEKMLLKKYGDDDTTKALIQYWFSKRKIFTGLAGASFGIAAYSTTKISKSPGRITAPDNPFFIDPNAFFGVAGAIAGALFLIPIITHSRKKLVRLLEDYKAGKSLPKKYRQRIHIPVKK